MKQLNKVLVVVIMAMLVVSCTAGNNPMLDQPNTDGDIAGLVLGLWHGFISLFSFIGSFFFDDWSIYEVHNNGTWYNLGFVIGASAFYGSSCSARHMKKK